MIARSNPASRATPCTLRDPIVGRPASLTLHTGFCNARESLKAGASAGRIEFNRINYSQPRGSTMTFDVRKLWCINPADSPSLMDGFSLTQGYASLAYILWACLMIFHHNVVRSPPFSMGSFLKRVSRCLVSRHRGCCVEERKKNKSINIYIYKVLCTKSGIILEKDIRIEISS